MKMQMYAVEVSVSDDGEHILISQESDITEDDMIILTPAQAPVVAGWILDLAKQLAPESSTKTGT
jgi:hypothetical protein